MSDTARIPRPKFPRRAHGRGGRTEHDSRGNAFWVRTRAGDPQKLPDTSTLTILDEVQASQFEGVAPEDPRIRAAKIKKQRPNQS